MEPTEAGAPPAPGASLPRVSDRVRIARLAHASAAAAPGVARLDPGWNRVHVSADPAGPLEGVTAAARPDGRYDVSITLVAAYGTALHGLAEMLRDRVWARAEEAGVGALVADIDVHFEDVADPAAGPAA